MKKILAITLSMIIIAMTFSGCGLTKINPNKYFLDEIPFTGVNGYGSVDEGSDGENVYDIEKLACDMFKVKDVKELDTFDNLLNGEIFDESIIVNVEGNLGKLKNGDEVEVVVSYEADRLNAMTGIKKKVKGKKEEETEIRKKYKVKGLKDPVKTNAFDSVQGVYCDKANGNIFVELKTGYSVDTPNGKLSSGEPFSGSNRLILKEKSSSDSSELSTTGSVNISPAITRTDNYQKGMKVSLELGCELNEFSESGIIFTSKTQEFEVKEAFKPSKIDQISNTSLNTIKTYAEKYVKEKMSTDSSGVQHSAEFKAIYFEYTPESESFWGKQPFKSNLKVAFFGIFDAQEQYAFLSFTNDDLLVDEEGNVLLLKNKSGFSHNYYSSEPEYMEDTKYYNQDMQIIKAM